MSIIYSITNTINQKRYIGKTNRSEKQRWYEHCWDAFNKSSDRYFYKAIRKHGIDCWKISVIENVKGNNINEREIYWIAHYQSNNPLKGYNSTVGGDGVEFTEEIRNKISNTLKSKNQSSWNKGVAQSDKSKIKNIQANKEYIWITDGTNNKRIHNTMEIDSGWKRGRTVSWQERWKKR